jgi:DNA-binding GntR family transcriptional regulator
MQVPSLKRVNLPDAIVGLIEDALLAGELKPGDRIIETDLAQKAGISRGPVREAIRQLEGDGILVTYPSRGTFVAQWTPKSVEEAYSLRATLERFAIEEAAKHITPDDIVQLQAILDKMRASIQRGDTQTLSQLDTRFHEQIYSLSRHTLLQATLTQLRRRLYWLRSLDQGFVVRHDEIIAEHQLVVDALKAGDIGRAAQALTDHILSVGVDMVEQVQQSSARVVQSGLPDEPAESVSRNNSTFPVR